jgi:hypothetical protein
MAARRCDGKVGSQRAAGRLHIKEVVEMTTLTVEAAVERAIREPLLEAALLGTA